jgi:Ca2+/Na+ antiporter
VLLLLQVMLLVVVMLWVCWLVKHRVTRWLLLLLLWVWSGSLAEV